MRIWMQGALGDEIAMTALVREYKKQRPKEMIRFSKLQHPQVYLNNPWVYYGNHEDGTRHILIPFRNDAENIPASIARQVGITLTDTQPEIFLTDAEKAKGIGSLDGIRRPIVTIDTRATHAARVWPRERFQRLVSLLKSGGWSVVEIGKSVAGNPFNPGNIKPLTQADRCLLNKQSLREAFATIAAADLHLGNDSGLTHAAAAVNTPSVVIFSIAPPHVRCYRTTIPVWCGEPCPSECHWYCARPNAQEDWCMLKIDPEAVVEAVEVAQEKFSLERRR